MLHKRSAIWLITWIVGILAIAAASYIVVGSWSFLHPKPGGKLIAFAESGNYKIHAYQRGDFITASCVEVRARERGLLSREHTILLLPGSSDTLMFDFATEDSVLVREINRGLTTNYYGVSISRQADLMYFQLYLRNRLSVRISEPPDSSRWVGVGRSVDYFRCLGSYQACIACYRDSTRAAYRGVVGRRIADSILYRFRDTGFQYISGEQLERYLELTSADSAWQLVGSMDECTTEESLKKLYDQLGRQVDSNGDATVTYVDRLTEE
jgi:hypothetical protein